MHLVVGVVSVRNCNRFDFIFFHHHDCIQVRSEYLALTHLVLTNSGYFEHCHRLDEIKECLDRILHEEEDVLLDKDIATKIFTRLKEFSTWTMEGMLAYSLQMFNQIYMPQLPRPGYFLLDFV